MPTPRALVRAKGAGLRCRMRAAGLVLRLCRPELVQKTKTLQLDGQSLRGHGLQQLGIDRNPDDPFRGLLAGLLLLRGVMIGLDREVRVHRRR